MSDGNRSEGNQNGLKVYLALLFLAAVVSFVFIGWGYSEQLKYQREANSKTQEYAANTYSPAYNACFILSVQDKRNCLGKAANEYREYERNEQDLVAQQGSALWAFVVGVSAVIGAVLSAVGVFLVWTTFRTATEGNKIARNIGEAQARAYLSIADIAFYLAPDGKYYFDVQVINSGMSPAKRLRGDQVVAIRINNSEEDITIAPTPFIARDVPGSNKISLVFDLEDRTPQTKGVLAYVSVNVSYSTVFNDDRHKCHARGAAFFHIFPPPIGHRTPVTFTNTAPEDL